MQGLLAVGLPVASSCYGDGVCGKCKLKVLKGYEKLSPIGEREAFLIERDGLDRGMRISCQATVDGDVTVDASYW